MSPVSRTRAPAQYSNRVRRGPEPRENNPAPEGKLTSRMAIALVVVATIIGLGLAFTHVTSVDAEISVTASELLIVVDSTGPFTRPVEVKSARFRNIASLRVPRFHGEVEALLSPGELGLAVADTTARITIAPLTATSGDSLLFTEPMHDGLTVGIHGSRVDRKMSFAIASPVVLSRDDSVDTLRYAGIKLLPVTRRDETLDGMVALADSTGSLFVPQLPIRALVLHRVSRADAAGGSSREESTLAAITVRFPEYESTNAIHPAEIVRVVIQKNGRLRGLRLTRGGIEASFAATISRLSVGGESAMPSYLEFFAKSLHVKLLYAGIVFIFTALGWVGVLVVRSRSTS